MNYRLYFKNFMELGNLKNKTNLSYEQMKQQAIEDQINTGPKSLNNQAKKQVFKNRMDLQLKGIQNTQTLVGHNGTFPSINNLRLYRALHKIDPERAKIENQFVGKSLGTDIKKFNPNNTGYTRDPETGYDIPFENNVISPLQIKPFLSEKGGEDNKVDGIADHTKSKKAHAEVFKDIKISDNKSNI